MESFHDGSNRRMVFQKFSGYTKCQTGNERNYSIPRTVGDLQYVKASTELLDGRLTVEWKKVGDKIEVKYEAPIGCKVKLLKE